MRDGGVSGSQGVFSGIEPVEEDGDDAEDSEAHGPEGEELREAVERREELECRSGDDGGGVCKRVCGPCAVC